MLPGAAKPDFPVVAASLQHVSPRPPLRPPPCHQHTDAYMRHVGPNLPTYNLADLQSAAEKHNLGL